MDRFQRALLADDLVKVPQLFGGLESEARDVAARIELFRRKRRYAHGVYLPCQWFCRGAVRDAAHRSCGRLGGHFLEVLSAARSEEHTSELQSLMRISYAVFCLKKKTTKQMPTDI